MVIPKQSALPMVNHGIEKENLPPEMIKAAENMESMFIQEMLKAMRETVPTSEMSLKSPATEIYQGMLDSEYSEIAAKAKSIGLADQIIAYWANSRYNIK